MENRVLTANCRISVRRLLMALTLTLVPMVTYASDLKAGDTLPDCTKIPLLNIATDYRPQLSSVSSLETALLSDGVVIVHFCTPRPPRGGAFESSFVEQLSDLQKAAQSVAYPCRAVAVLPFGEKGRADASLMIEQSPTKPWGETQIFYEPTFPRPGLYRTFRPGTGEGGGEITAPFTYLIGPGRKILAVRDPASTIKLYDWLQQNLPATVVAVPNLPSTTLSMPKDAPWVWPSFGRTPQRQPIASVLPDVLPYTYLAWQTTIGRTFASPVVVDNVVYANTDSKGLQSLALATGQPLMSYNTGPSWWSSPVVAGNLVYSISSQGVVHAIDRGTFQPKWKRDLGGLITSSPVVSDGALFVGSRNGAVYALDASSGEILWRFQTGGEISSSPALSNGLLVIGSGDRSAYALDAKTGTLKWSIPTEGPVDSSPTIAGDTVYIGSFDGGLYSLKLTDGTINWRCQLGGWVHSSPAVDEDKVFVGTVNRRRDEMASFNWVDRKTGKKLNSFEVPDAIYSSPTIWGDLVLIGCRDHNLYAFDRKMRQNQPAWTYKMRSYIHASPVVVGDTVLVASFEGDIYALRQSKPIRTWTENDIVPRWFVAALTRELHKEVADLIAKATSAKIGAELSLRKFDEVFAEIKASASKGAPAPKVLPRDVPGEHPGAPYIEYVLTASLLTGYPDGSFRPNEPTTRYQFSFGLATVVETVTRPDFVWKSVGTTAKAGVQIEVRIQPAPGRQRTMPRDVPQNHWAYKALSLLAENALAPLDEEGLYRGIKSLTLKDAELHWNLFVEELKVVRAK
jgi:outer membrane protein assembly factor BamB